MATIFNNIKSNGTSPAAYYTVWATVNKRNENNVVLDVYMNARLGSNSSSLGTGSTMGLDVYFNFAETGQTAAWRIKATNESWSKTTNHRLPSSGTRQYTVNVSPSTTSVSTKIKVNRTGSAANTTSTSTGCWVAWRSGTALAIDAWKYNVSYNANGGSSTPTGGSYACGSSITLASAISRAESTSTGTITITYNANNGTGAPGNSTGTYTNATPYTFNGWHVGSASGTNYNAGAAYTIPQGDTTFYAGWTTGTTYRKSNPSITLSTGQPTRTGYEFLGWSTNSGATTASYSGGNAYTFSADTILYAVWRINQFYFDVNPDGGIASFDIAGVVNPGTNLTDYYQQNNYGTVATLSNIKAKTGYTYTGYSLSGSLTAESGSTNANPKVKLGNGSGAIALISSINTYWNDINAYTPDGSTQGGLMFDLTTSDGGKWTNLINEPPSAEFTKPHGTTATISNIRSNVTGAHYTSNSVTGTAASTITWTFNTVNYVVHMYSAWNTYYVAFNANNGSGSMANQTFTYNTAQNLTANNFSRTGYNFLGWSTNPDAIEATYLDGASVSNLTATNGGTVTLYAIWASADVKINFKNNNAWIKGIPYVKNNGEWKKAKKVYVKINNVWKEAI